MRTRVLWLFPAVGILFTSHSLQAIPVHQWSQRFGDASSQIASSTTLDVSGNVVVAGAFVGTVDFGGGPLTSAGTADIFVAKFGANGSHVWSQRFGDASGQGCHSIAVDALGNVVITGRFGGSVDFGGGPLTSAGGYDIFIAKFDANGNHLWSQRFGDAADQVSNSVAADGSGNVVITGRFDSSVDFGGGPLTPDNDSFIAKFDPNGGHLWSQNTIAAGMFTESKSVAADGSGNVVITGYTVDWGGPPPTEFNYDIAVIKFDTDGSMLWQQYFGDLDYQEAKSVAVDGSGNIVITGGFRSTVSFGGEFLVCTGDTDIFVAKFDASGTHVWSQSFGDDLEQVSNSVAADASGNVVITGSFGGTVDFGGGLVTSAHPYYTDIFLATFDASGNHVWSEGFGNVDPQVGNSVAVNGSGNVVLTGALSGTTDFGGGPLTSAGGNDIFVASFSEEPTTVTVPPLDATLGQNFPNPFNPATTIEYTLSKQSSAVLGIYDAAGRLVVQLEQGVREAGTHRVEWNGRNGSGRAVGSGVYFYRLEGAPGVVPKKMVLLK